MRSRPAEFQAYLYSAEQLEIQIIYTQINRDETGRPSFKSFRFNADSTHYFYPASTVKLPLVLLALEKLNRLNLPGLDRNTTMLHDSAYAGQRAVTRDSTSENGMPSVAHYAKKILIVSDNDAFNRLYEFVGQEEANRAMWRKGYHVRFLHRLDRSLTADQNRHTEPVRFLRKDSVVFSQPMLVNTDSIRPGRIVRKGIGYMMNDSLVNEPFDFTYKNFYPLEEQQEILKAVLFPEAVDGAGQFNLSDDDRKFVWQYMSQMPRETANPPYHRDTTLYDAYCKFLMYGESKDPIPPSIRIFNKVGDAYGFMIDNAYVVDFDNKIEFMLAAVINTNTDGIYNDGKYEYSRLGFPFMQRLGRLLYDYEKKRERAYRPDLEKFKLKYDRN
jgi:hypothetical protein